MQAKANGEGERKREGERRKRGEWERVMGTERLCKTKERERRMERNWPGGGYERAGGWQQQREREDVRKPSD